MQEVCEQKSNCAAETNKNLFTSWLLHLEKNKQDQALAYLEPQETEEGKAAIAQDSVYARDFIYKFIFFRIIKT